MSNPLLIRNFTAGGAITAYRLVLFSADETVIQSATSGGAVIGACGEVAPASGERVDVVVSGMAYIEAGAAVVRGALVMSDTSGRAITAAATAGTNVRIAGIALEAAAAAGDQIRVLLSPGNFQG
jgi:hypothetical protein